MVLEEVMVLEEELEELHETEEADYIINESGNIEDWIEDTQNTLTEILPNETSRDVKVSPTVNVPGYGVQFKSTIVKLLKDNPTLSNDRLVRVRENNVVQFLKITSTF